MFLLQKLRKKMPNMLPKRKNKYFFEKNCIFSLQKLYLCIIINLYIYA